MDLRLVGFFRANDSEQEPIIYEVSGLPVDDHCIIGYAGERDGMKKWHLHWYRSWTASPQAVPLPDALYDSPREALSAVEEIESRRPGRAVVS